MEKLMKDLQITDDISHKVLGTQELIINIFCSVSVKNIFKMRLVCRLWNDILQDDHTWQKMFEVRHEKISNPLFLYGQTYKTILLYKEYYEKESWKNVQTIIKTPPNIKYKLFEEMTSLNSYIYDIISVNMIKNGIAIAFASRQPLIRRNGNWFSNIEPLKERPTISNMDFTLVPNLRIEIYLKIIKFNQDDNHKVLLFDEQAITTSYNDIIRDIHNWNDIVRMKFGKEYYMYSSYVSLGTCKIFSFDKLQPLCHFNVNNPPIYDMALSNNLFVVLTKSGKIQITTKLIVENHSKQRIDLANDEKLKIALRDIMILGSHEFDTKVTMIFYLDQNDFMVINYINQNNENVIKCWDLRKIRNVTSFKEDSNYQDYFIEYTEILPTKAHSITVRWRNLKNGSYEYIQEDDNILPEIIVTCLGGTILIYHPVEQQMDTSLDKTQNNLKLVWKINTGLTSCKMIDTSFWTKDNFPKDGDWLFLSAKRLVGDMKVPVVLQVLLSGTTNNNRKQTKSYGYTCIDGYNPNELQDTFIDNMTYKRLPHRILCDKLPYTDSTITQVMPYLPHCILVVCQSIESKRRPKSAIYIYDYHTSSIALNQRYFSPLFYLSPTGYYVMSPSTICKDDVVFVPLPKSRTKNVATTKMPRPKLTPGSSKLKVNRKPGTKRGKQPKSTKIEKRKRNQSSKVAYSPRDYDIDYDDDDDEFDGKYDDYDDYEDYEY
ncbi:unnamed protein product [Rhizophagus irregularis]|uniref:F-box domain-containing protein n=1 Tax=Rhizophagus irregularis TaxID=588596 RepID=A0A2N1MHT6_9GLOM|nr:hypothetical protein RhiirC2_718578 [Rhizophagus irregularis]CAB4389835.1 unnamed protein product [Rhizophagus irregularis]CAB5367093.1 unnamed protein product [Rhizophagus irregularis]